MFGDMLRNGLGLQQEQQQAVNPMPAQMMGFQGALMAGGQGFQMSPQSSDMFGQYNNPMMFLRRM